MIPFKKHSQKDKIIEMDNRLVVGRAQGCEGGAGVKCGCELVAQGCICGDGNLSWWWCWLNESSHMIKLYRTTHTHT